MNKRDLKRFQATLEGERDKLLKMAKEATKDRMGTDVEDLKDDMDLASSELDQSMVYRFRDPGWPVGMVVDEEGTILVAVFRAGAVAFVSPEGKVLDRWEREGSMPTDIAFGGPESRTVYVTDAAGKVEAFEHGARGLRF